MAFSTEWRESFCNGYDQGRISGNARAQRLLGGTALAGVAFACAFTLWLNLGGSADRALEPQLRWTTGVKSDAQQATVIKTDTRLAQAQSAYAKLAADMNSYARQALAQSGYARLAAEMNSSARQAALSNSYARLFDSHDLGGPPGSFTQALALAADNDPAGPAGGQSIVEKTQPVAVTASIERQAVQRDAAAKPRVPPIRAASLRAAAQPSRATADAPAEKPSIFERLFGKPAPVALAYAAPDDSDLGGQSVISGRYDHFTAVYDISAHKVYLPDGNALEAHSGLGSRLDDPRHVDERMHGATPPTVYNLKLRESPFHGVQAIRLIPEDERQVFGRSGLLAHTYMLGPNGDSNGCVSFKNYNAFLHAYLNGRIKRLAVVTRLD